MVVKCDRVTDRVCKTCNIIFNTFTAPTYVNFPNACGWDMFMRTCVINTRCAVCMHSCCSVIAIKSCRQKRGL
jgi:hypothetical protein